MAILVKIFTLSIFVLICNTTYLNASETQDSDLTKTLQSKYFNNASLLKKASQSALLNGLPNLAESISTQYINSDENIDKAFYIVLIDALIAQGKYEQATNYFKFLEDNSANNLRKGLVLLGLKKLKQAQEFIENIKIQELSSEEKAWYNITKAYEYMQVGNNEKALEFFNKAKELSYNDYIYADILVGMNLMHLIGDINSQKLADLEKDLSEKVLFYMGTQVGFQLAKQYVAVLYLQNKKEEALATLNAQLQIELAGDIDIDELKLMSASMTDDASKQYTLLKESLSNTNSIGAAEYAIILARKNKELTYENWLKFLDEQIAKENNSIKDRFMLEKARICFENKNIEEATKTANDLITNFPASEFKIDALKILALSSFLKDENNENPSYRLTANYLLSIAQLLQDETQSAKMRKLAADCYALNKDFTNALQIYLSLLQEDTLKSDIFEVYTKALSMALMKGDYLKASEIVDSTYKNNKLKQEELADLEWLLISYYESQNMSEEALDRIDSSILNKLDPKLKILMLAKRVNLLNSLGRYEQTLNMCNQFLSNENNLKNLPEETIAKLIFVKANALLSLNKAPEDVIKVLEELRKAYPKTEYAQLSYLYQAKLYASIGKYDLAEQMCKNLVDEYPDSKNVYLALMDAANYLKEVGSEANYKAALSLLEDLCNKFKNEESNFYARLMQADILRLLNAFAEAKILYNDILQSYPSHSDIISAWIGLGDVTLSQPDKYNDAVSIFERIYSLPNIPTWVKAESAYKWTFALDKSGNPKQANELRWILAQELLGLQSTNQDGGKYWISRILLDLAKQLELTSQKRDARNVYEMIIKNNLPGKDLAKAKLKHFKKE